MPCLHWSKNWQSCCNYLVNYIIPISEDTYTLKWTFTSYECLLQNLNVTLWRIGDDIAWDFKAINYVLRQSASIHMMSFTYNETSNLMCIYFVFSRCRWVFRKSSYLLWHLYQYSWFIHLYLSTRVWSWGGSKDMHWYVWLSK